MRIAISGARGLIGSALSSALRDRGDDVIALTRSRDAAAAKGTAFWDPLGSEIDSSALEGLDAVVHLAGEGIAESRWTPDQKKRILESRTKGTSLLATTLASLEAPPGAFLSGSAIGFYGVTDDEGVDESAPPGEGFLPDVCRRWEAAAQTASDAGIPTSFLRTGIVLSPDGGALAKQLPFFRLGLGGRSGSGTQYQSWISISDEVGAILSLIDDPHDGPVNLTAPTAVRNRDFARALASALHRPSTIIPMIGPRTLYGKELADSLLLESQRVLPAVLEARGYQFAHPTLDAALSDLLR